MPALTQQIAWLFLLALPVACIAWTVTHEEIFREPREFCVARSKSCKSLVKRKFFYMLTCEYCFSFYVTIGSVLLAGFYFLLPGWHGIVIAVFSVMWVANVYMTLFGLLRLGLKNDRLEATLKEEQLESAHHEEEKVV
jgi:hypothetical protein